MYKPGDKIILVNPDHYSLSGDCYKGQEFTVVCVSEEHKMVVPTANVTGFYFHEIIHKETYESPLYQALKEIENEETT